jgi:hypothetical protein
LWFCTSSKFMHIESPFSGFNNGNIPYRQRLEKLLPL